MNIQGEAWGDEADGEGGESDDDEIIDMDLPDNLTFLNSKKISKVQFLSAGIRQWTIDNDSDKNYPFCRLKFTVRALPVYKIHLGTKVFRPTNKKTSS